MNFKVKVEKISKNSGNKLGTYTLTIDSKNEKQAFNTIKSFNKKFSGRTYLKLINIKKVSQSSN